MTTLDFIFLGVLAVFLLIGLWRGFLGMLLGGFASFLISLGGAILIEMFIGDLLYGSGIASSLQDTLIIKFNELNPVFTQIITSGEGGILLNGVLAETAMKDASISPILATLLSGVMNAMNGAGLIAESLTLTQCAVPFITRLIIQVATGIAGFIVLLIIIAIIRRFCSKLLDSKVIRQVDKSFGIIVMAVLCCGIFIAVGSIANMTNVAVLKDAFSQSVIVSELIKLIPIG